MHESSDKPSDESSDKPSDESSDSRHVIVGRVQHVKVLIAWLTRRLARI